MSHSIEVWFLDRTGYRFEQAGSLTTALTHRSAKGNNNERLEFLGDAILGFAIAERLFNSFPQLSEGELTRKRASLVRRETLSEIARERGFGPWLTLGCGELKSGGRDRDSILADAFEASIGAVYLDGGMDGCAVMIDRTFQRYLTGSQPGTTAKDYKTRLQEYLQARGYGLPKYAVVSETGPPHARQFEVSCTIVDLDLRSSGRGDSRRRAEQHAAESALGAVG